MRNMAGLRRLIVTPEVARKTWIDLFFISFKYAEDKVKEA